MEPIISQKFNTLSLLKFALPTTVMMMILSVYTMVDGIFVSNFIGENAFSAVNIIFPYSTVVLAIGIMFATGGNAIIAKQLGENKPKEANQNLSLIVLVGTLIGVVALIVGTVFTKQISALLGSTEQLNEYSNAYLFVLALFSPFSILQAFSQMLFVTAGKPNLGLITTTIGGLANILFDWLFIVIFDMGIAGAALGTGISYTIPGITFILYLMSNNNSVLKFEKPKWRYKVLLKTCANGSSELVSNLSNSVITLLFNLILLKYAGEQGVAAIGIILYTQFLLMSVFLGYSQGVAPIFSYAYGADDKAQLKKVFQISIIVIIVSSLAAFFLSMFCSSFLIRIFVKPESAVFSLAKQGFRLFSFSFIFMGINIFASSIFTSFSNGRVSATISFLRTFVFILISILLLPMIFDLNGVWLSVPCAELLAMIVSVIYLKKYKRVYHY